MMTRDPFRFFLSVAMVVLSLGAWGHAQFLTDPSFEAAGYPNQSLNAGQTVTANGWTFGTVPGSTGVVGSVKPGNGGTNGAHFITLHTNVPNPSHLFIQQNMVGLTPGNPYSISFDASRNGANGFIGVFLDGSSTASFSTGNIPSSFTTFTFTFVATNSTELLSFQDNSSGAGGASDWNLDNIVIAPLIPEANPVGAAALLVVGIGLMERRRFRKGMLR
jgi:hypothetical protein